MQSKQSRSLDRALGVFSKVRKSKFDANCAIKGKRRVNSKPYKLGNRLANRYGITVSNIAGVSVCTVGSGSRCIMYMHGGTYVDGPTILHYRMWSALAVQSGYRVVAPVYGRAPIGCADTTVPSMYEVYCHLQADESISTIVVMGDSAGGGLALALCEYIAHVGGVQPSKMILICPWLDVDMTNADIDNYVPLDKLLRVDILRAFGRCYAGDTALPWLASPIGNITAGLAPIDIFVGSHELFLPDCLLAKELADKAGAQLRVYEFANMQHVFPLFPIPEAIEAGNMIVQILEDIS